ncbi:MAG: DUF4013 domain-containing protein [Syntrophomonadaceae bacterium]|nr:DUF4013 domain-containing protein [Syntrophomonadaceae bacterium]
MYDLKRIFTSPFQEREGFIKMILGSIISIVPVLNLLSLGYLIRCIRYGWMGLSILPTWDNWAELLRDGCIALLILVAYLLFPLSIGLLILAVPAVGIILASLLIFIMSFLIPMAVANYAIYKNIKDAFRLIHIFNQVGRVFNIYIVSYSLVTLGVIIGMALLLGIPYLGFIGGLFIFYCGAVFFNFIGFLYREAT